MQDEDNTINLSAEGLTASILEAISDGISIQDTDFRILYQNKFNRDFNGPLLGELCYKAYEGNDAVCEGCPLELVFKDGGTHLSERCVSAHSGVRYFEVKASPLKNSKGELAGGIEVVRDITERKKAEEQIKESENRFRGAFENAAVGASMVDLKGRFLKVNSFLCGLFGYSESELLSMTFSDITHPDDIQKGLDNLKKQLENKADYTSFEKRYICKDGRILHVIVSPSLIRGKDGMPRYFVGLWQDITELKKTEERLQKTLEEYRQRETEITALHKSSSAVLKYRKFKDAARSIFESCRDLLGARSGYVALLSNDGMENEVLFLDSGGLPCTVDPSLPMPIRGLRENAYLTGKAVYHNSFSDSKWNNFLPEGHVCLDNVLFSPLVIDEEVVGLLGLANKPGGFTENDARMALAFGELAAIALLNSRTLEAVENSEERFRSVVETATDAIITIDKTGNVVSCNHAAENIFGCISDELIGKPLALLMPERFREAHRNGIDRILSGGKSKLIGKTSEAVGLTKQGREFPLELSLAKWETGQGVFFTGLVRDITERKQFEISLKTERDKIQKYLDIAEVILVVIDPAQRVSLINRKGCEILGCEQEEVIGENWFDNFIPDKNREEVRSAFCRLISGDVEPVEYFENIVLTKNGEERIISWHNSILKDECGGITGTLSSGTDITQRKKMEEELQRAKDELEIKVKERTGELKSAVELLQEEVIERKELENTILFYQDQLRTLMSKLDLIEERERKRISEHLHDNISQNLAISKIKLETIQESHPVIAKDLNEIHELIEQIIKFVRSSTFELSSPVLYELGFIAAVEWLIDKFREQHNIVIKLVCDKNFVEPKGEAGILLYKTIRELLMNIVKHSQAKKAKVSISGRGNTIEINIEDSGIGFDTSKIDLHSLKNECFGILSIRERTRYLKGTFVINSKQGEGTKVKIVVPSQQ